MTHITADSKHFMELNDEVRAVAEREIVIDKCIGQRYIASGSSGKKISINGVPGNALGAYLDGSDITVNGNAQDATGDTMNAGTIVIHGNAGDGTGYGMRGGAIYIRGNSGYRTGIHMKSYKDLVPAIVVGGKAGSFLGEYQAGGIIIVLGLESRTASTPKYTQRRERGLIGNFCGTGIHGGAIYLRAEDEPKVPSQVAVSSAKGREISEIQKHIDSFCAYFTDAKKEEILQSNFFILKPNSNNPYKQLYTHY